MRYDTEIYFQKVAPGEYDESTGDYSDDIVEETMRLASVVNTDAETLKWVYGAIRQGSLTLSLQRLYTAPYDRIRIGKRLYQVDAETKLRTKHVLVVSGV